MIALVPTCNRPSLFARLVSRLQGFEVIGFVNNSTAANLQQYRSLELPDYASLIFTDIAGEPKACHVHTFRYMLEHVNDKCLVIEDDVFPCSNFHDELSSRIRELKKHHEEFTLSPIYLPNRNSDMYTGGKSHPVRIGDYDFIDQAWVDGNFYMTAGILREMKDWIRRPVIVRRASSGIGRRNSIEIFSRGWKMFTAVPTMVEHLEQESVMFGLRRQEIPLIARFNDR